jgi:hypothetical protein
MHNEGHPWRTEELFTLRAEQRKQLRDLNAWILDRMDVTTMTPPPRPHAGDRLLLELELRRMATEAIATAASPTLDSMAGNAPAAVTEAFLRDVGNIDAPGHWKDRVWDQAEEARRAAAATQQREMPKDAVGDVQWAALLLVMTEYLSDDGYQDSRLPAWVYA